MKPAEAMRYLTDHGARLPCFQDVDRFVGYTFPVPAFLTEELPSDEGLALWWTARQHAQRTGLSPVLVGPEPMIDWFAGGDADAVLAGVRQNCMARTTDVLSILAERASKQLSHSVVESLRSSMAAIRPAWRVGPGAADIASSVWPAFLPDDSSVRCILLGCTPAELPIYLGLGSFYGSPKPTEQAAIFARWFHHYGAQLAYVGSSTIGLWVAQPPTRIDFIQKLLWEAFIYCPDLAFLDFDEQFGSLRNMLGSPWWSFTWDGDDHR